MTSLLTNAPEPAAFPSSTVSSSSHPIIRWQQLTFIEHVLCCRHCAKRFIYIIFATLISAFSVTASQMKRTLRFRAVNNSPGQEDSDSAIRGGRPSLARTPRSSLTMRWDARRVKDNRATRWAPTRARAPASRSDSYACQGSSPS